MRISDWSSDVCSSDLRAFLKNPVEASINAFLLETSEGLVLIDAGAGEVFGPGYGGRLVESLAVAGVEQSQIRHVLITHVHSDHSGRSATHRVGKECVSTGHIRWATDD